MKEKALPFLLFLGLQLLLFTAKPPEPVVINSISSSLVERLPLQVSSMAGGSLFYIQGTGFDMQTDNNVVFVGDAKAQTVGKLCSRSSIYYFMKVPTQLI